MEVAEYIYQPVFLKEELHQAPRPRLSDDDLKLDRVSFCLLLLSPLVMAIGALGTIAFTIKTGVNLLNYLWAQHTLKNSQFNEKIQEVANPIIIKNSNDGEDSSLLDMGNISENYQSLNPQQSDDSKDLHIETIKDIWKNYRSEYAEGDVANIKMNRVCLEAKKSELEATRVLVRDGFFVYASFGAALYPFGGGVLMTIGVDEIRALSASVRYLDGKLEMDELTRIQFHIDKCEVALEQSGKNVKVARYTVRDSKMESLARR